MKNHPGLLLALIMCLSGWSTRAERVRPFLCRDAVLRESALMVNILEDGAPLILRGAARPGLKVSVENAEIARAAEVLRTGIEKTTGVECAIAAARGSASLLGNGSFEEPPRPDTPLIRRTPLHGSLSGAWTVYHNTFAKAHVFLAPKHPHGKLVSASVEGLAHLSGVIRRLELGAGRRFRISLWYRTAVRSGAAFCGVVHIRDPIRMDLPTSREWKRFTAEFVADNPRGNWLQLILGLRNSEDAQSQVWFDDVRIEEVGPTRDVDADVWQIHVGAAGDPRRAFPELEEVDDHGFLIATKGRHLHLVGRSGTGTLYAAWFFLQNYAGMRIVGPGPKGEVCPKLSALSIPRDLYVLNPGPDYLLRIWTQRNFDHAAWLQDTGRTCALNSIMPVIASFPPTITARPTPSTTRSGMASDSSLCLASVPTGSRLTAIPQ